MCFALLEYCFLLSPLHALTILQFLIVAEDGKLLVKKLLKQFFTASVVSDEFVKHCRTLCQAFLWGLANELARSVSIISQAQSKMFQLPLPG